MHTTCRVVVTMIYMYNGTKVDVIVYEIQSSHLEKAANIN